MFVLENVRGGARRRLKEAEAPRSPADLVVAQVAEAAVREGYGRLRYNVEAFKFFKGQ